MKSSVPLKDINFEPVKGGIGAGGQHSAKNATGVRATHIPTGVVVVMRGRSLAHSKKRAVAAINKAVTAIHDAEKAGVRKDRRDEAIKPKANLRTYHEPRGTVKDHRTGRTASYKDVMEKGRIDLLR